MRTASGTSSWPRRLVTDTGSTAVRCSVSVDEDGERLIVGGPQDQGSFCVDNRSGDVPSREQCQSAHPAHLLVVGGRATCEFVDVERLRVGPLLSRVLVRDQNDKSGGDAAPRSPCFNVLKALLGTPVP